MRNQGGHLIPGQMAKAFSSAYIPLHLCRPGNLTSLRSAVQSKKALLAIYLNEGGIASSGRAAQFMNALTLMVWSVGGKLTSLRLAQCTKVNFFHECGRRVGGVPRSSLKGKETQHDEGRRTQATPKPNKNQPNKNPKTQPKGQRPNPPHLKVFPLYEGETGETGEKSWLETVYGPEFTTKVGR